MSAQKKQQEARAMYGARPPFIVAGVLTIVLGAVYWLGMPHYKNYRNIEHKLAVSERQLAELWRGILLQHIGLYHSTDASIHELALAARNFVYSRARIGKGGFDKSDPVMQYLRLSVGESRMLCDGMAEAYRFVLLKLGIRSRRIQLATVRFVAGERDRDTHVSVEVHDDDTGRWYASDPTFNVSWRCDGETRRASYEELRSCHAQGRVLRPDSDGQPLIEGRRVEDYYLTYDSLLFGLRVYSEDQRSVAIDLPYPGWWEDATNVF